jgi:transcriptional regulator with XRE-family HTH domain
MDSLHMQESFRGLLLRHRGRSGLIQRDIAARAGVSLRSVQDWEAGVNHPTAERLRRLIQVLLETDGLVPGQEIPEARALWEAVQRESPRTYAPFDEVWFVALREVRIGVPAEERFQDWGEALDTSEFVNRSGDLARLRRWVTDEGSQLVAILGMGGIGKTSLAARMAQDVAPGFERLYWRSVRDAPPVSEWLVGAIGFLSGQR